jgi:hypothetical protein
LSIRDLLDAKLSSSSYISMRLVPSRPTIGDFSSKFLF